MASGALIERAGAVPGVLGDMRRHPDSAAFSDEVEAFLEKIYPVYRQGVAFLQSHPVETNCICASGH
jgi:hypothetical protein